MSDSPELPQRLAALPLSHPYRALAEGRRLPTKVTDMTIWELARPTVIEMLAADPHLTLRPDSSGFSARRSIIAGYIYDLAAEDPDLLVPAIALSEDEIVRRLELGGTVDRKTLNSKDTVASVLRSLRTAYPDDFFTRPRLAGKEQPVKPPVDGNSFGICLDSCDGMHQPSAANCEALLLLCRGAGLDGPDLRCCCGMHIETVDGVTWVHVSWGSHYRSIPVLARFGSRLQTLADDRQQRLMIADTLAPCHTSQAGNVCQLILARSGIRVSPTTLRRAWIAEHLERNTPIRELMYLAGVDSMRCIESVIRQRPVDFSEQKEHLASACGGR